MDLRSAVIKGTMEDLEQALQTGKPADHVYSEKVDKSTPIHWASYNKFNDKLERLIKSLPVDRRNKALNLPNMNNVTPLFEAIWLGPTPEQADADPHRTPEEKLRWRNNYAMNACKVKIDQARLLALQKQKQIADIYRK